MSTRVARRSPSASARTSTIEPLEGRQLCASGDLNTVFSTDGRLVTGANGEYAQAISVDRERRLLVAATQGGDVVLRRLLPDGTHDASFSGDGYAALYRPGVQTAGAVLALRYGYNAVAGVETVPGTARKRFFVARYDPNGKPDANFGTNGVATFDFAGGAFGAAASAVDVARIVERGDGRLMLVGSVVATTGGKADTQIAVVQMQYNGAADATFFDAGRRTLQVDFAAGSVDRAVDALIDNQSRLVIAFNSIKGGGALRLTPKGALDTTFGAAGHAIVPAHNGVRPLVTSIGRAYFGDRFAVGGRWAKDGVTSYGYVAALDANGKPDAAFNAGKGYRLVDFGSGSEAIRDVAVKPDGKIFAAGERTVGSSGNTDLFVAAIHKDGSLDAKFNQVGYVAQDYSGSTGKDYAAAIDLQPTGTVTVLGNRYVGAEQRMTLTQYVGDLATPAMPVDFKVIHTGTLDLTVGWTPVGSAQTAFRVEYSQYPFAADNPWVYSVTVPGTAASTTLRDLAPNTKYYLRVRAVNDAGGDNVKVSPIHSPITTTTKNARVARRYNIGLLGSYVDAKGQYWANDGRNVSVYGAVERGYSVDVANTPDDRLYSTYVESSGFDVKFAVANGRYRMRLLFVDPQASPHMRRDVRVYASHAVVAEHLDIYDLVGGKAWAAGDFSADINVTDGEFHLSLSCKNSVIQLAGIELVPVG